MVGGKNLKVAYSLGSLQDSIDLYKEWAPTYDTDFAIKNEYKSPSKVAKFFHKYSDNLDSPILDVGAGTGLVGECIAAKKTVEITALDISSEMLAVAKAKNIYSKFVMADLTKPLDIENNKYGAIVSAGTFTHGHVGPEAFDELVRILKPMGLVVVSIHSEVFQQKGFKKKLLDIENQITKPVFHKVSIYRIKQGQKYGNDKVFITVFRKRSPSI
ncbi:MAG: hypothetical protein CML37_02975 [Rhodobacteraceae bacterium]|nr:hypothetical protein [Paracoccaceae bacterium]